MVNNPPALRPDIAATSAVLLVAAAFEENAKRVESHLRNAGHRVRAVWISDAEELEQFLRKSPPDVVMASDRPGALPLRHVIDTCRRFAPMVPVLSLATTLSGESTVNAVASGARDLVADGDSDNLQHLEKVFLRELQGYRQLRDLARAQALLADYQARYTQLIDGTGDAVAHVLEGILGKVNPAFSQLLGYAQPQMLAGLPLMDLISAEDQARARDQLKRLHNGRADGQPFDCQLLRQDGSKVKISAQLTRGEADGERFVEMLIRAESSEGKAAAAHPSRMDFFKLLEAPARSERPRAVIFAAVDRAAALEERIGHYDFEQLVLQVGDALQQGAGSHEPLFRFSAHEFVMVLERPDAAEFASLSAQWVKALGTQVFSTRDHESQLTLSICVYPLGANDHPQQVCRDVVAEARKLSVAGGNALSVLGPTARANEEEKELQRKVEAIRRSIEDNRLKLAYQTIASLEGDTRRRYDVQVRMINEDGVEVRASDFMSLAERAGLSHSIDRWVVSRALKILGSRDAREVDGAMLFLKLSEDTLKHADGFMVWLRETLKTQRMSEDQICFEIQEGVIQSHVRKAKVLIKTLRELGASVAIEHFGSSANSAQLVEHLPVNYLKFHMSFTHRFGEADMQARMTDLMKLAKQRQIRTIVSHVEDANIMALLWQMGVNFIQGYHIQEPEVVMLT
ncbi:MAG: EAL domain-containing protein [Panacagrimonas sp.]